MTPLRTLTPLVSLVVALALAVSACDSTEPAPPPTIRITQPSDSAELTGDIVRILTETSSQCGCNAHVEFFVNGTHVYSHYQPFYFYDWNIRTLEGEYVVRARLVVRDDGEANDSIRVFIRR